MEYRTTFRSFEPFGICFKLGFYSGELFVLFSYNRGRLFEAMSRKYVKPLLVWVPTSCLVARPAFLLACKVEDMDVNNTEGNIQ
jgi:hypothetical protein